MSDSLIERYLNRAKLRCHDLKEFVEEVYILYTDCEIMEKTKIRCVCVPGLENGYLKVVYRKKEYSFYMVINLFPFRKKNKTTTVLKLFYLYVTILHEIEHIKIILNKVEYMDKSRMLALLEYLTKKKSQRSYDWRIANLYIINKYHKLKSMTSQFEIECNYLSVKKGLEDFKDFLSDIEMEKLKNMYRGLQFLRDNLEIGYISRFHMYNNFIQYVVNFEKSIQEDTKILVEYPQLRNIYSDTGKIKLVNNLFENMNDTKEDISNYLIFYMFLYMEIDFTILFAHVEGLKKYIEDLANEYKKRFLLYMDSKVYGELLVDKEILEDNERLMIKNVARLNLLMDKYGMNHTIGVLTKL